MTANEVRSRIETVTGHPFRGADGRCPHHDDNHESLSVNQGEKGVVLKCHAGCETADVLAAAGLTMRDLFDTDDDHGPEREIVYRYTDEDGVHLYDVLRFPEKKFRQRAANGEWKLNGTRRVLYRLPEVYRAIGDGEPIWIAEGEKDVDALARAGVVATCNPMGAGSWKEDYTGQLWGATAVTIVADRDAPGLSHARQVAEALREAGVPDVRVVQAAVGKDAADHLGAGRTIDEFVEVGGESDEPEPPAPVVGESARVVGARPVDPADLEPQRSVANGLTDAGVWTALASDHVEFLRDRMAPRGEGPDLPEFPTEVLPPVVAQMVEAVAVALQVPADIPAMFGLAVLATATCGRLRVDGGPEWSEMTNLFVAVLAEPGGRKSAVAKRMRKPIWDAERRLRDVMGPRVRRAQAAKEVAETKAKAAKSVEAKWEAKEEVAAIGDPVLPRLLADDATPEELGVLLADHGGRFAILSAEGTILANVSGKYMKADATPSFTELLAGHANDPMIVDRVNRPTKRCDNPALTLGLTVQPEVITRLNKVAGARRLGVIARFLYAYPKDRVGHQTHAQRPIPPAVAERYERLIGAMVEAFWWRDEPLAITLDDRAQRMIGDFFDNEIQPALRRGGDLFVLRDWGGKLHGSVTRIAGLLQAAGSLSGKPSMPTVVSYYNMEAAIEIGRYLVPHVLHIFGADAAGAGAVAAFDDVDNADARAVLTWAAKTGRVEFTHRDFLRSRTSGTCSAGRAKAACQAIPPTYGHSWVKAQTVHVQLVEEESP